MKNTNEIDLINRIEQLVEGIAYASPETRNERLAEIVTAVRREIREWKKS
jgi:hypothetical protein